MKILHCWKTVIWLTIHSRRQNSGTLPFSLFMNAVVWSFLLPVCFFFFLTSSKGQREQVCPSPFITELLKASMPGLPCSSLSVWTPRLLARHAALVQCNKSLLTLKCTSNSTLWTTILRYLFTFIFNDSHYGFWEFPYASSFGRFCGDLEGGNYKMATSINKVTLWKKKSPCLCGTMYCDDSAHMKSSCGLLITPRTGKLEIY